MNKSFFLLSFLVPAIFGCTTSQPKPYPFEDLTKVIIPDTKKDYHLGPIGARGWMHKKTIRFTPQDFTSEMSTAFSRQILVTAVEEGSPADKVLKVGDVIIGIGDTPFAQDPRKAMANAINEAEKHENKGELKLLIWREDAPTAPPQPVKQETAPQQHRNTGSQQTVTLKLKTLGTYSDTAPYNCPKSEAIYKQTLDAVYREELNTNLGVWALALLATGEEKNIKKVASTVKGMANIKYEIKDLNGGKAWNWGYQLILLCEYYLMTGDKTALNPINEIALALSRGQSIAGTWGHFMAQPKYNEGRLHGRLEGYATLNQPSITCLMGMVLAEKCGVKHPEFKEALRKSYDFYAHYTGKGAIPYGYGPPREYLLTNNGTSATAAIAFSIKGDTKGAKFFSTLCGGAAQKVEIGHTGHFFNYMWTGLGANVGGPKLASGYFKDGTWRRTMTRKWNGGYVFQRAGGGEGKYGRIGPSSAMLLHFSLPKRQLYITGKDQDKSIWLNEAQVKQMVDYPRMNYKKMTDEEILNLLGSDIPPYRVHAADELAFRVLGTRDGDFNEQLKVMLKGTRNQKIGACHAISRIKAKGESATKELLVIIRDTKEDLWVRNRALDALSRIGESSRKYIPELLEMLVGDLPEDHRRHLELNIAWAITNMAEKPIHEKYDKELVFAAAKKLLSHPRMRGRIEGMKLIKDIGFDDFHLFADQIVHVIRNKDPKYTTYQGDGPSKYGLYLLDRLNIKEGIDLGIETIYPGIWGQKYRISGKSGRIEYLKRFGANAKPYLEKMKAQLGEKNKEAVAAYKAIEESKVVRKLITLEEAKKTGDR